MTPPAEGCDHRTTDGDGCCVACGEYVPRMVVGGRMAPPAEGDDE